MNATGRVTDSCWQTSSIRLPNGSSKPTNARTRRDRAASAEPRATANPARSSDVSAASSASMSATLNPDAITPDWPSTSARQWWRPSARRWATPSSVDAASSSPTMSVAKETALARSAAPDRT